MARAKPAKKRKRSTAVDSPIERLQRTAARWYGYARSGDAMARATSRVLSALAWAMRERDTDGLRALEQPAIKFFEDIRAKDGRDLDQLASEAAATYEKIMTSIEHAIAPVERENVKRERAAQFFIIKAREFGFDLPVAPHDDGEAVAFLLTTIRGMRQKVFDDDRDRAEAWTRAMAKACGRDDGSNAAKARMKQVKAKVKS